MIIGAILQTTSFSYAQLVVARIITGLGNGLNVGKILYLVVSVLMLPCQKTSTVPAYHAECSPASHRGSFIMLEGSLITFGIMIS
jgi:MFS family permease